jgi:hypothetical protein
MHKNRVLLIVSFLILITISLFIYYLIDKYSIKLEDVLKYIPQQYIYDFLMFLISNPLIFIIVIILLIFVLIFHFATQVK